MNVIFFYQFHVVVSPGKNLWKGKLWAGKIGVGRVKRQYLEKGECLGWFLTPNNLAANGRVPNKRGVKRLGPHLPKDPVHGSLTLDSMGFRQINN